MRTREDSQPDQQSLALSQSPDPMSDTDSPSDEVDALGKHKELYTLLLRDFNQISKAESRSGAPMSPRISFISCTMSRQMLIHHSI